MIVIQHEPLEGPGSLAALLPAYQLVRTYAGDAIPAGPGAARAVIVLGGGMGVGDQDRLPHLREELALLRACVERGTPVLGLCLGAQLLAVALGARVAPMSRKEIGFYRVRRTAADPLFDGLEESFVAFHWHGDAFELPAGAMALASSTITKVQAFCFRDRFYGVQFHPEVDEGVLRAMVAGGAAELAEEGIDGEALLAQGARELPRLRGMAEALVARFLAIR